MLFPCLMYLASLGTYSSSAEARLTNLTEIALSIAISYYQISGWKYVPWGFVTEDLELPYFSISLSLNIILTILIAGRLILHSRNIRRAVGSSTQGGLYKTVVTMVVESCVLYAIGSLLFIGPLSAQSPVQAIFAPCFGNIQVRVVFDPPPFPQPFGTTV